MSNEYKFEYISFKDIRIYALIITTTISERDQPFDQIYKPVNHLRTGQNNKHVQGVWFNGGRCQYLPINIESVFPNIVYLSVFDSGLKELTRANFVGLSSLAGIVIYGVNYFNYLPDDLFIGMNRLTTISINSKSLQYVNPEILDPLIENELDLIVLDQGADYGRFPINSSPPHTEIFKELRKYIKNTFKPYKENTNELFSQDIQSFTRNLLTALEEGRDTVFITDFEIISGEYSSFVHSFILASHSGFFRTLLKYKKQDEHEVTLFAYDTVKEFIRFMYTGDTPDPYYALELFDMAQYYDVPALRSITTNLILTNLDDENLEEVEKRALALKSNILQRAVTEKKRPTNLIPVEEHENIPEPEIPRAQRQATFSFGLPLEMQAGFNMF